LLAVLVVAALLAGTVVYALTRGPSDPGEAGSSATQTSESSEPSPTDSTDEPTEEPTEEPTTTEPATTEPQLGLSFGTTAPFEYFEITVDTASQDPVYGYLVDARCAWSS
jgi:cytoskeletal protein RodZ